MSGARAARSAPAAVDASAHGRRLVLAGGGHAHLEVLRALIRRPLTGGEVTLISPFDAHHYSSMVPGFLRGVTRAEDFAFDLPRLCAGAGVRFVRGWVESVDTSRRLVHLRGDTALAERGEALAYDVLSLDVGSAPAGETLPGVAAYAFAVRPMARAIALEARLGELLAPRAAGPRHVVIVGAGAAGVETALAIATRARDTGATGVAVTLLGAEDAPLSAFPPRARRLARSLLDRLGIAYRGGATVERVESTQVVLRCGTACRADLTVWMTGAAPPALFARSPSLRTDARGWLPVGATLRAVHHQMIFGAGDAVAFPDHPHVEKAGVYAVHAAPTLAQNLRSAMTYGPLREYTPQRSFLALLDTADGRALLRWRGIVLHARWAKWLKNAIDRRFLRRYQSHIGD